MPADRADRRSAGQRRADALVWLARHALNTAPLPAAGGRRAQLSVLVDLPTLHAETTRILGPADPDRLDGLDDPDGLAGLAGSERHERLVARVAALLPRLATQLATNATQTTHAGQTGRPARGAVWTDHHLGELPPGELLRLTCDATLRRIITDGHGEPLNVGRATRTVPAPMRAALDARDHGCVYPGCDRPPTWCEAHHLIHHLHGGPTSTTNTALVCEFHHALLHKTGTTLIRSPDGTWQIADYQQVLEHWKRTGTIPGAPPDPDRCAGQPALDQTS